jgi:dipeptidyl-peptidase-4
MIDVLKALSWKQIMTRRASTVVLACLLGAALVDRPTLALPQPAASAVVPQELTVEWVFGDEGRRIAEIPSFTWCTDGTVLIYDDRRPEAERTFERLDPATGERRPALDMPRAVSSLAQAMAKAPAGSALAWPAALDGTGRQAIYTFDGDLFLLELPSARFARVTDTPSEEKSVSFSPDGTRLAYVRDNDLYVYDIGKRTEIRATHDGSETTLNGTLSWVYWEEVFGRRDIGYWWSPDSRALAYLQTDESPVEIAYFVDFAPQYPRLIRQRYPKAGTSNPRVRVGIAEIGGASAWIQITDEPFEYVIRVKWLPDSARVAVQTLTRNQERLELYFADRRTGASRRVLTETDPGWINSHDDLHFLADGRHFLWASERDGYMHLYRYTLDGRLVNQVTKGAWALASSGSAYWVRQSVVGIDEADGWVYFTAQERSSIEKHLYRVRFDGSAMSRLSTEDGVHRISLAPDTRHYLDVFSDSRSLPSLSLRRAGGALLRTIAPPRPERLAAFDIQYPEALTIPAADGFRMPAQLLKPRTLEPGRKYPVVIFVYGGPSAPTVANAWRGDLLFEQLLLREGFAVMRVDNRAATAISKRLENTILRRSGEPETADLLDAVRWLKAQPWADPDRIGVWGWSGGGTMTLNLMTRSKEFKAGIAVAPVTDWRYYDTKWAEAFMKLPSENPDGYDRTSLVKRARELHGRLLLIHGTYDDNVHPQNAHAFLDALIAAGKPVEAMIYPMRKHGIDDPAATAHIYKAMLEFWKRAL